VERQSWLRQGSQDVHMAGSFLFSFEFVFETSQAASDASPKPGEIILGCGLLPPDPQK
jgi:hypothetical protein